MTSFDPSPSDAGIRTSCGRKTILPAAGTPSKARPNTAQVDARRLPCAAHVDTHLRASPAGRPTCIRLGYAPLFLIVGDLFRQLFLHAKVALARDHDPLCLGTARAVHGLRTVTDRRRTEG